MGAPVDLIKRLIAAGIDDADLQAIIDAFAMPVPALDEAAERRRAKDRERKRISRGSPQTSAESAEQRKVSPDPSKEITTTSSEPKGSSEVDPPTIVFPTRDDLDWAVSEWNELAEDTGLPAVKILNAQRRRSLTRRLRELGHREAWTDALMLVARSPFCCGENDRGWRANFDFVLQPSSMAKLLEGNYAQVQKA